MTNSDNNKAGGNSDLERLLLLYKEIITQNIDSCDFDTNMEYHNTKSKIEKELEKAKKYDDLMKANSEQIKENISNTILYQKYKEQENQLQASRLEVEQYKKVIEEIKEECDKQPSSYILSSFFKSILAKLEKE